MAWYVSKPALVGAFCGLVLLLRQFLVRRRAEWVPFLSVFLTFSLLYFWKMHIVPDHPWAMRRYLPVILPGICVTLGVAVSWLWSVRDPWRRMTRLAALVVMGVVLTHEVAMARAFWTYREKQGVAEQLAKIAGRIPDNSILLTDYPRGVHPVAVPLAIAYRRPVLTVIRSPRTDPEGERRRSLFEAQVMRWLRDGREVLYLRDDGQHPTFLTHTIRWEALSHVSVEYPTIGESFRQPPRSVQERRYRYRLLRAASALGTLMPCTRSAWSAGQPLLLREEGFYTSERNADGRFRWAMPRARIVFASCDRMATTRPRAIYIRAACGRDPSKADCRLRLKINGHVTDALQLTRRAANHVVSIPSQAVADPVGAIEVGLLGPEARRRPHGRDKRTLSFQLSGLRIE
jgi:hypothetical protein